jgi:hypothetical protein
MDETPRSLCVERLHLVCIQVTSRLERVRDRLTEALSQAFDAENKFEELFGSVSWSLPHWNQFLQTHFEADEGYSALAEQLYNSAVGRSGVFDHYSWELLRSKWYMCTHCTSLTESCDASSLVLRRLCPYDQALDFGQLLFCSQLGTTAQDMISDVFFLFACIFLT